MMPRRLAWCLFSLTTMAMAAVAPLSKEEAFSSADVVLVGVLGPPSVEEVEQREGVVNAVATSTITIMDVEKGEAPATVRYWWALERPVDWTGTTGQQPRPPSGVPLRLFAASNGELLTPNGWEPYEGNLGVEVDMEGEASPIEMEEPEPVEEEEAPVEEIVAEVIDEDEEPVKDVIEKKHTLFASPWKKFIQRIAALAKRFRSFLNILKFKRPASSEE